MAPPSLSTTRRSLHGIAELLLAGPQHRATGEIAYEPRALYDYVQHGGASLGHAAANQMTSLRDRLRAQRPLRERVHLWRMHYFVDICRLQQFAAVLDMRCAPRMP